VSLVAKFRSFRPWLNKEDISVPVPTQKEIPDWYKDADRFAKMPNGEYYKATKEVCPFPKEGTTDDYGKIPTWKACPAIMDAFATGYVFKTPCDLTFSKNSQGIINVTIDDPRYKDFCTQRPPMPQFEHPKGYYGYHFAWSSPWGLPFFIVEGWEGTIPAGTPYLQVLPFKRENWEHEIDILDQSQIYDKMVKNMQFFRQPDGGVYKNKVWSRREYK